MDYTKLNYLEKKNYLIALFAVVKNQNKTYAKIHKLLTSKYKPSIDFLDKVFIALSNQKQEMITQQSVSQKHIIENIHRQEDKEKENLDEIENLF